MAYNAVVWFEIYVQDVARSKKFYETVFSTTLEKVEIEDEDCEMWLFPCKEGAEGSGGMIIKMQGVPSGPGGTMVYFFCEDCAVEEARASANGGEIIRKKFAIGPYGFCSIVKDTEGNHIGLHSMK